MKLYTKFWGTRGSIPTPGPLTRRYGGNTSCIEIYSDTTTLICDAGSGLRNLGQDLLRRPSTPPLPSQAERPLHLFLSHTHWDHIQGFPLFAPAYLPSTHIRIYDLPDRPGRFFSLLSGQMQSEYFPVRFSDLRANITPAILPTTNALIGDIRVTAYPNLSHPGGSTAYSFQLGSSKVVYATDNEVNLLLDPSAPHAAPPITPSHPSPLSSLPTPLSPAPLPISPDFIRFVQDADLLIADAQYSDAEYLTRTGWGHSSLSATVDLAVLANVKRLALFHHDPMRTDPAIDVFVATALARAKSFRSPLQIFPAREGTTLSSPTHSTPTPAST